VATAEVGLRHARISRNLRCRSLEHDAAALEDIGPIGELERLGGSFWLPKNE
jgi:hypothetical protein